MLHCVSIDVLSSQFVQTIVLDDITSALSTVDPLLQTLESQNFTLTSSGITVLGECQPLPELSSNVLSPVVPPQEGQGS